MERSTMCRNTRQARKRNGATVGRRIVMLLLTLCLLAGLGGCGREACPIQSGRPTCDPGTRIAMISTAGALEDNPFNQGIWEGIQEFSTDHGIECLFYQPERATDQGRKAAIDQAISEGANVIVAPGAIFGRILSNLPQGHQDVTFIAIDLDPVVDMNDARIPENLYCVSFAEEQAGYLAGYAAVIEGHTKLGFLGGGPVPPVVRYGQGFVQGADKAARELKKPVEIRYNYAGTFLGNDAVTERMEDWYSTGTEVVFACGGAIWTSVLPVAVKHKGKIIGVDTDQHDLGENYDPNPFLTSATKALNMATRDALEWMLIDKPENNRVRSVNLDLKKGEYLGLPTSKESWEFKRFTPENYKRVQTRIVSGEILIDHHGEPDTQVETSEYTTVSYED